MMRNTNINCDSLANGIMCALARIPNTCPHLIQSNRNGIETCARVPTVGSIENWYIICILHKSFLIIGLNIIHTKIFHLYYQRFDY